MTTILCTKNVFIIILFINCFYQILALPHVPEVVYPRKPQTIGLINFDNLHFDAPKRIISTTTTTTTLPSIIKNSPPLPQRNYQKILNEYRKQILADSSAERRHSRILLAPIEREDVLTAEDYSHYDTAAAAAKGVTNHLIQNDDFEDNDDNNNSGSAERIRKKLPKVVSPPPMMKKSKNDNILKLLLEKQKKNLKKNNNDESKKQEKTKNLSGGGGFKGQSFISEIDPNQRRTTMAEPKFEATTTSTTTITTPIPLSTTTRKLVTLSSSTIKSGYIRIKAHPRPLLTTAALNGTKNVRASEIDSTSRISNTLQSLPRPTSASADKRFPAEKWQLPPSLSNPNNYHNNNNNNKLQNDNNYEKRLPRYLSSTLNNQLNDYDTRRSSSLSSNFNDDDYPPPTTNSRGGGGERYKHQQQQQYYPQQQPPPQQQPFSPFSIFTTENVLNPFQALTAALNPTGQSSFLPQSRPQSPQQYHPSPVSLPQRSSNHSHLPFRSTGTPKYHATFAKHNDVIKPIPLPSSGIDENDMDLLSPMAKQLPSELSNNNNNYNNPIPIPYENGVRPVPISPITTTFGEQRGLPIMADSESINYKNKSNLDPNSKLDLCCRKYNLSPSCLNLCNFDTFTDKTLVSTFLSNSCPEPQRGLAFQCATTKVDHTECCRRNNLHLYSGGQCMPFCATHIPTPPNIFSYLPCLQVFDTIKNCYKEYQYTHPNIFGD